jgi:hypothetical protein
MEHNIYRESDSYAHLVLDVSENTQRRPNLNNLTKIYTEIINILKLQYALSSAAA